MLHHQHRQGDVAICARASTLVAATHRAPRRRGRRRPARGPRHGGGWRTRLARRPIHLPSSSARCSAMPTLPAHDAKPSTTTKTTAGAGARIGSPNGEGVASVSDDGQVQGGGYANGDGGSDGALSLPPSPQSSRSLPSAGESAAGVEAMTRMLTWLCCSRATGTTRAGRRRSPLPF